MMEIREEEGERDSERRDGPGDEIGSDSVMERIRNCPMYSPPRSLDDWVADLVQSPPQDLFGLQFGCEAYLPPATTTVCNIEASLGHQASLFGLQFEYDAYLPPATTTVCNIEASLRHQASLFGLQFEYDAYLPPATITVCNIEISLSYEASLFGLQFEYESHLKGKSTTERPKSKNMTAYLITSADFRQLCGHKRAESADAAQILVVSVSTFKRLSKRLCRKNGSTWRNGDGCSLVEPMLVNNSVQQNSSGPKPPEVQGEKEISALLGARQDAQTFELRPGVEIIQLDSSEERIFGELGAKNIGQKVESAEKSCIAISHSKKKDTIETPKRKYRTKRSITLDDLRPLFDQKRVDAAKKLGVSVATFKRYCRQHGITWWNGDGCSRVEPKLVNNSVQQNSSGSKPPEVQGEKEISALLGARQDAVTIKAKYGEGNLKFQLSSESSLAELQEAVAKRLMSKAFIVEYEDEDQEPILIACDEDWQACVKFFGNQVIRLAIREKISNSKKSHGSGRELKRKRS